MQQLAYFGHNFKTEEISRLSSLNFHTIWEGDASVATLF